MISESDFISLEKINAQIDICIDEEEYGTINKNKCEIEFKLNDKKSVSFKFNQNKLLSFPVFAQQVNWSGYLQVFREYGKLAYHWCKVRFIQESQ